MNRTRIIFIVILLVALLIVVISVLIQTAEKRPVPDTPAPTTVPTSTPFPTPTSTSTPSPTPTSPPTPTHVPTPTSVPQGMAIADGVEVYAGPNPLVYPVIAVVDRDDTFEIVGRDAARRFWQICCVGDEEGWVAADLIQVSGAVERVPARSAPPFSALFALRTYHGTYITALDGAREEEWAWALRGQATEVQDWEQFELRVLESGKITLRTYFGRYVTASRLPDDWRLRAVSFELTPCGEFTVIDLGEGWVALETCYGTYWTAMDGARDEEWAWALKGETDVLLEWERFELIPLQ